jgi:hypothetical protein
MLPLRQVQLLHASASFFVSALADVAYNNFTGMATTATRAAEPWSADARRSAEAVAAAAAGTGDRIARSKYASLRVAYSS